MFMIWTKLECIGCSGLWSLALIMSYRINKTMIAIENQKFWKYHKNHQNHTNTLKNIIVTVSDHFKTSTTSTRTQIQTETFVSCLGILEWYRITGTFGFRSTHISVIHTVWYILPCKFITCMAYSFAKPDWLYHCEVARPINIGIFQSVNFYRKWFTNKYFPTRAAKLNFTLFFIVLKA